MPAMTVQNYTDSRILILTEVGLVIYGESNLAFIFLSRQVAEACGGTLEVESKVNAGSTFVLSLPCGRSRP